MKLSIDIPNPLNNRALIYLDGELLHNVIEASEEDGYVVTSCASWRDISTETLHGKVEIKLYD